MKKFYRNFTRIWKAGAVKSMRMLHIFLPLSVFFAIIITFSSSFFFAYGTINHMIKDFEDRLNIVVYLDRKLTQMEIDEVTNLVQSNENVRQIEFISQSQALEVFKEKHKNEPLTLEALAETGTNPFGASIVVFAKDPAKYSQLNSDFQKINTTLTDFSVKPIESVSYEDHRVAIEKFARLLKRGEVIFAILLIIISITLLFVVYLALRFATQGDKDEIKIMKLVGAPTSLIVGPTTVMGIISGFLGGFLALFVLYFIAREITPQVLSLSNFNVLNWYLKNIQYFIIFAFSFGIIIGFFGSLLAIRRHL